MEIIPGSHCYDPDLLLTSWSNSWIVPYLLKASKRMNWKWPFNRESDGEIILHVEITDASYAGHRPGTRISCMQLITALQQDEAQESNLVSGSACKFEVQL